MNANVPDTGSPGGAARFGHMLLAVTVGIALVGFLMGVRGQPPMKGMAAEAGLVEGELADGHPAPATHYLKMAGQRRGPNATWPKALPEYVDTPTDFFGAHAPTPEQRAAAVAARSERRAFSGAPPVVPHAIDQRNAQSCLACHGEGLKLGAVVAPRMSHHYLANCTQCHVEAAPSFATADAETHSVGSQFVGLAEPGAGERIGPGAPPTIPHPLWMRSNCSACHGSLGDEGLRSSHPWRTNCTQCHAPTRQFDAAPLGQPPGPAPDTASFPGDLAQDRVP